MCSSQPPQGVERPTHSSAVPAAVPEAEAVHPYPPSPLLDLDPAQAEVVLLAPAPPAAVHTVLEAAQAAHHHQVPVQALPVPMAVVVHTGQEDHAGAAAGVAGDGEVVGVDGAVETHKETRCYLSRTDWAEGEHHLDRRLVERQLAHREEASVRVRVRHDQAGVRIGLELVVGEGAVGPVVSADAGADAGAGAAGVDDRAHLQQVATSSSPGIPPQPQPAAEAGRSYSHSLASAAAAAASRSLPQYTATQSATSRPTAKDSNSGTAP